MIKFDYDGVYVYSFIHSFVYVYRSCYVALGCSNLVIPVFKIIYIHLPLF